MFNILIVEDNQEKLKNIIQSIKNVPGIDIDSIEHDVDSLGAKKRLRQKAYDLLILDIAIPLRKSDAIDLEGGIKLLNEILVRDIYKIPTHIIGLTAREEIFKKASEEFNAQILSVIRYSNTDIEWQTQLSKGVEQRVLAKNSLLSSEINYDYDIAIITAIDKEYDAIRALSKSWQRVNLKHDSSPYYETIFQENEKQFRVIAACASQMGMNASSVLAMKLIYNFRPRYLFMTGILASVKDIESHGYGDIIVINESWDGGAGKITQTSDGLNVFQPVANHIRLNIDIAEKIRSIAGNQEILRKIKDNWKPNSVPNTELAVHIGSVASVAGVIENAAVIAELKRKDRKLLGLEMEAHGVYYSANNCSHPRPIAIALKSVADFANVDKNDMYQGYASYTSSRIMYEFIFSEL